MTVLSFRSGSSTWLERLPLGDGRLGAMVGVADGTVRVGVNEATAWSGGIASARRDAVAPEVAASALAAARAKIAADDPHAAEAHLRALQHRYSQAFLPVGEIVVETGPAPVRERSLDLRDAVHRAETTRWRADAACAGDVVLQRIAAAEPMDALISFETSLRTRSVTPSGADRVLDLPADVAPGHEPDEPAVTWEVPGIDPVRLAVALRIDTDGVLTAEGGKLRVTGARRLDLAVAVESTYVGPTTDPSSTDAVVLRAASRAQEAVADAAGTLERHRAAARRAADAFSLTFGAAVDTVSLPVDDALDTHAVLGVLAAYGRYLLRSASRPGLPPANLQGIWNDDMRPPWSSNYTLNINTPMNYWGAEGSGASEAHLALLTLLEGLAESGADTAGRLYGARGWVAHHNSDAWAYSLPTRGDASWSHWSLGGAWLVRQFDEHRRHGGMTDEVRARYLPVLAGCAQFLLDILVEADGGLHTVPSTSPENRYLTANGPVSVTRSSALDRALIREVLGIAADVLPGSDGPLASRARAAAARIEGPRRTADGRVAEWDGDPVDEDPRHRHLSHLYPWFPGDSGDDAMTDAAMRTLDTRGDDSTGWSLAWKIALRARLRDADGAARLLALVRRPATEGSHRGGLYPNLFAAHPPFQIDGNLGLLGALLECVVQSHRPGRLDLLPAVPAELATGRLRGAVVRPGLDLDLDWEAGAVSRVRLRARRAAAIGTVDVVAGEASVTVQVTADADTVLTADHFDTIPRVPPSTTPDRSTP